MSLLGEEEAAMPTLEEVVAFIDSWDTGSASPGDVTTSESENENPPFSKEDVDSMLLDSLDGVLRKAKSLPANKAQFSDRTMKKKAKKAPGASTRLQRRKKTEILTLRALVEQLEGRLAHLKHKSDHCGILPGECGSSWAAVAASQFQERLQSEVINHRLRGVFADQLKVNNALCDVLRAQTSWGNLDGIFGEQPGPPVQYPIAIDSFATIGELEKKVEDLFIDSRAVFRSNALSSSSCVLQVKQEQNRGRVFEISSATSLPCTLQETSAMFWRDYLTVRQSNDKCYHFLRQRKPASVEKSFKWVLQSGEIVMEVNGFSFVRKVEEPNRVVLVEADRLVLPTGGTRFRIQRWTIITRHEASSKSESAVRTLFQLRAENAEGLTLKTEDLRDVEGLVLGVLSTRFRDYLQKQQDRFIQRSRDCQQRSIQDV